MTEKEYIELMNKEVEGLISEEDRDQLHTYLKENPQINELYLQVIKTSNLRKQVSDIDPSPNLKKNIINVIDSKRYTSDINRKRFSIFDWNTIQNPRVIIAFAAGVVIGLIFYAVVFTDVIQKQGLEKHNFYGTIGIPENANIQKVDQVTLDFPEVLGTVDCFKFDNIVWLDFKITSTDRCEMIINFDQSTIFFESFRPIDSLSTSIINEKDKLNIHVIKKGHFLLQFNQTSSEYTQISLKISHALKEPSIYNFQISTN